MLGYRFCFGSADLCDKVRLIDLLGTLVCADLKETMLEVIGKGISLAEGQIHT